MPLGYYENLTKYKSSLLPFICRSDTLHLPTYLLPHWHEGMEILYCTSGEGQLIINGSVFDFSPGKAAVINPSQIHSVIGRPEITYKCIIIFGEFCKENGIDTDKISFNSVIESIELTEIYQKMYDDFKGGESALKIRLDALELLYTLQKNHFTEQTEQKETAAEGIKTAIHYINRNYSEDIALDTIAEIAGLSKYYFTKMFKEMTKSTFSGFLGSVRCHKAAELIRSGKSVSEACFLVGYNDPAYFSRVFTKLMGTPPSKYK